MSQLSQEIQLSMLPGSNKKASNPDYINAYILDEYHEKKNRAVNSLAEFIARKDKTKGKTVCIIENISEAQFKTLESEWRLEDKGFWENHSSVFYREKEQKWLPPRIYSEGCYLGSRKRDFTMYPGDENNPEAQLKGPKEWDYVEGTFEYHGISKVSEDDKKLSLESSDSSVFPVYLPRACFPTDWSDQNTLCSNTRISYYRVNERTYLFLVDAPLLLQRHYRSKPRYIRPTLRFHYAMNWGGVLMPLLLKHEDRRRGTCIFSISKSLVDIFKHRWQRDILFQHTGNATHAGNATPQAFPGPHLLYVMANSLSRSNYDYLKEKTDRISFRELRSPELATNERLHDLREDIVDFMSKPLAETIANVQELIGKFWDEEGKNFRQLAQGGLGPTPLCGLKETKEKVKDLERFLLDSFQLQMNSVSIREARIITQLTVFTLIFLPTAVVSGIFGMNVQEFNGSAFSIWVWAITDIALTILTLFIFLVLTKPRIPAWIRRMKPGGDEETRGG